MYESIFKEDTLPICSSVEKKQDLDPNYYSPNYVSNSEEDAPTLVDNLLTLPVKSKEENRRENTKEEIKGDKMQTKKEDSEEDNDSYTDSSNSDYIN